MSKWTTSDIPSQAGRLAVVTGTGGLGYETALALARAGAEVVVAGRNPEKGNQAIHSILAEVPKANVHFEALDLADLSTVTRFAERLAMRHDSLDILVNNAGVMVPPKRETTKDGFELQFGTNYLGHYALTARLLPLLRRGQGARVVSLSSVAARAGQIDLTDLQSEKNYVAMTAYSQSKLACLMFAVELQRQSAANGWNVTSLAAHPGVSRTDLLHNAPGRFSPMGIARSLGWFLFQPAWQGALPTLYAATDPNAQPGAYYGPNALSETRGYPVPAKVPEAANDKAVSKQLWDASAKLANVQWA
ncbi:short-chain dehydrogenase [Devosia sp. Leaf420]|uniref:oxidoreductase n=1 Tax=Devosia sp. Leaf420 TaxID=1736374 RepID=UPI000715ECC2|nr:oxidoreductase [Devosia sp. Leaf420]KQT51591.1 short-chain dehydrogenase [Devosia sp. Leaf420]